MWKPIFNRPFRAKAFAAIEAVAAALLPRTEGSNGKDDARAPRAKKFRRRRANASLAGGTAGIAILYGYLSQAWTGLRDNEIALCFLKQAADAVSALPMDSSLYEGFTGVAWSVAHLRTWLLDPDDNSTESIDQILNRSLSGKPWRGCYDLVSGLVGFGAYALEQLPRPLAIECLKEVINRLDEIAERNAEGITWFTPPHMLIDSQRKIHPNGYYDLGVAHGVPGVIALLGRVCSLKVDRAAMLAETQAKAQSLLDGAVPWLLTQKLMPKTNSIFPHFTGPSIRSPAPSRVAWCYGDLGIAVALLAAASRGNKAKWKEEALRLARDVARRPESDSGVKDCGLCHGAAGVGHLFNRLFQGTGEPVFKQAARSWFERTLRLRRDSQGIAGFFALGVGSNGQLRSIPKIGLLQGATGVALALLAAATDVEPNWDRMMMISIPPKRGPVSDISARTATRSPHT